MKHLLRISVVGALTLAITLPAMSAPGRGGFGGGRGGGSSIGRSGGSPRMGGSVGGSVRSGGVSRSPRPAIGGVSRGTDRTVTPNRVSPERTTPGRTTGEWRSGGSNFDNRRPDRDGRSDNPGRQYDGDGRPGRDGRHNRDHDGDGHGRHRRPRWYPYPNYWGSPFIGSYWGYSGLYGYGTPYYYSDNDVERDAENNVRVDVSPGQTEVWVNGMLYSRDGKASFRLPNGVWRVELRAPGYVTEVVELNIVSGSRYTIDRKLRRAN